MKMIINGKTYNTDTATMLGEWSNGYPQSDFRYCEETLYKKKTGEFFLYGDGGPMSKYSRCCGNDYSYGSAIIPLLEEDAKEWAEAKLDADEYCLIFGEPDE